MIVIPSQTKYLVKVKYKNAFVEAKVMVDRFSFITTTFFVSAKTKTMMRKLEGIGNHIWGAELVVSKDVGDNEVVAYTGDFLSSIPIKAGLAWSEGDFSTHISKVVVQEWDI
jgi:hypothetical protein